MAHEQLSPRPTNASCIGGFRGAGSGHMRASTSGVRARADGHLGLTSKRGARRAAAGYLGEL